MKLIINADDFGFSESINDAIVQSFHENLISSTTLMTNMPGFEDACNLIEEHNLHGKVGIHFNLTAGYPLTEKIALCEKFCDGNGKFRGQRNRLFYLNKEERHAVYNELEAQLNKMLNKGIIPTHIDSHHHYHTEWAIGKQVTKVAQNNNIMDIRLTRNCGKDIGGAKKVYKNIYNLNLRLKGLAGVQYFGSVKDVININKPELYDIEIMVHPGYDKDGRLVDLARGDLYSLIEEIKYLLPGINLSTY